MAAVVDGSVREEQRLSDRGVEVRPDPFFRDVSRRLGYELIVVEFEVEARQRATPMWKPHLTKRGFLKIERIIGSELTRRSLVPLDHDLVQDLAQDVRLRVHEKLHLFEHRRGASFDDRRKAFDGWLGTVMRSVVDRRLSRYISSTVPIEVDEGLLPREERFEDDVLDRIVLSHLVPSLEREPSLGDLVRKRKRGETMTATDRTRWKRNVHLLVTMCQKMGVTGWE